MATLNGGIGATDELIRITGTPPAPGTYFTLDSEALRANGAARGADGRSFTRDWLAVDRGVAGTTKATHSNGATLTPYYPDAPGGVGLNLSLLTAHIAFDAPGVGGDLNEFGFVKAFDLPDNSLLVSAFAIPTIEFDPMDIKILLSVSGDDGASILVFGESQIIDINGWAATLGEARTSHYATNETLIHADDTKRVFGDLSSAAMWVSLDMPTTPATVGEMDVYAIIATPAA